jgi:signal transduction histidine kinase
MPTSLIPAVELSWSPDRRITRAEGDAGILNGRPEDLIGRLLEDVLGISAARAEALDTRARSIGGVEFVDSTLTGKLQWLRVTLGVVDGQAACGVQDLASLLVNAPPLQISALSSSLSHEIRNPLSSVKMAVQTLARNQGHSERDQRRLSIANREIRTMERMLSLLSEYGRDVRPGLEPVSVHTLVTDAASLVEPELKEKDIRLAIDEAPELPKVLAEPGRFRPVLAQLLLNIAMGLPQGGTIEVGISRDAAHVLLTLLDPAAALPPEEEATVFEPFGSRLARGAGLSLAALKRAMLGQKGSVWAHGGMAPGTTLTLCFMPV